jgi:hypothetical protein
MAVVWLWNNKTFRTFSLLIFPLSENSYKDPAGKCIRRCLFIVKREGEKISKLYRQAFSCYSFQDTDTKCEGDGFLRIDQ